MFDLKDNEAKRYVYQFHIHIYSLNYFIQSEKQKYASVKWGIKLNKRTKTKKKFTFCF